jgi:hypothetical protein
MSNFNITQINRKRFTITSLADSLSIILLENVYQLIDIDGFRIIGSDQIITDDMIKQLTITTAQLDAIIAFNVEVSTGYTTEIPFRQKFDYLGTTSITDKLVSKFPMINMWPFRLFILCCGIIDIIHMVNII